MDDSTRQDQTSYPLIRIITFGEFAIERRIPSAMPSSHPPCYARVPWEEWGSRGPAITLLKVLLCCEGRRASREKLIQAIWPDNETINATHALDVAASVLRRRVLYTSRDESLLLTIRTMGETGFKLPTQQSLWVDADAFLDLAAQAVRNEIQGQNPLPWLEQAHELAQGVFLEDNVQHKWSRARRNTIDGARHRVLYKLVEIYLRDKRVNQAEELLFAFLEEYPTDEDALYHLLILLAEHERRQEALNIYEYVVDVLREEHVEPTPHTQELVRRIRHGLAVREKRTNYAATVIMQYPQSSAEKQFTPRTVCPQKAYAIPSARSVTLIETLLTTTAQQLDKAHTTIQRNIEVAQTMVALIPFSNQAVVG